MSRTLEKFVEPREGLKNSTGKIQNIPGLFSANWFEIF